VRVVKASELSELVSQTLTRTLVRWIVDLNFGVDVAAPRLTREFRIEESSLTMPDVSLLIQSGFTPTKEWITRHFRVDLQEQTEETQPQGGDGGVETGNPAETGDMYESIFGTDQEGDQGGDSENYEPEPFDTTTEEQGV